MSLNRRTFSALVMIFILLPSTSLPAAAESNSSRESFAAVFTGIEFVSNIETIGVAVSGTGLPSTAQLSFRQSGETLWRSGHHLFRIDNDRLIGSLFNLLPSTSYDVRILAGSSEIIGSTSTQPDQLSFTPTVILHVNDDASPGGNGSSAAPYRTIQEAVNHAAPGTQVLVADGLYREAVTFPASGTAGNWIQVKAAGNAAILDSADRLTGNIWTAYSTSKVWFTRISGPVAYLARDGNRFYQYDDRTGLLQAKGHGGVTINEGWYYEPGTSRLYVRSQDNPAGHTWRVPRLNHAFDVAARNWLWIEGFEIRYYGTTTNGCGVCTLNASHLVIRSNKIHNMQLGIFVNWTGTQDQGNDTRIEGNEIYDPGVYGWPWAALKGSFMEGTGIIVRGHTGAIVRDNIINSYFNGIYTGSSGALENSELAFDADIYSNTIYHISDDGLEPEGACINHRFRNNIVDRSFIGISLAPVTQGPTWVLHSTFTNFTGRGIKFADHSDGIVLIYHNTGWTNASNINGTDLITSIHNVVMRNNIFQSSGYSFAEVPTGSTGNDWNHDNWYTTRGSTGPHFKWENVNYNTISALCSATGLECNGYETPPGFTNPTGGDFTLLPSSPNIDRGVHLPGINDDYVGNGPDAGAYESGFDPAPIVLSSARTHPNPTNAASVGFIVTFSEPVTGVDTGDFILDTSGVTGTSIGAVNGSGTTYTVTVNTGTGDGTIHLIVLDDNSIVDAANNPLDGSFTTGETYTVIKSSNVSITIGGILMANYIVPVGSSMRVDYLGVDDGPVKITHLNGRKMIAALRAVWKLNGQNSSYSELMGLPMEQLSTEYYFPWYSNTPTTLDQQLRFGNVDTTPTTVEVSVGSQVLGTYELAPGQSLRQSYAIDNGPVRIRSTNGKKIIAAMRAVWKLNGQNSSYSELMGLPKEQLSSEYYFPWYNFSAPTLLDEQFRFGNVDTNATTVEVSAGGEVLDTYSLEPGEIMHVSYAGLDNGPVRIRSTDGKKIIAAMRAVWKLNGQNSSYSELMGLPKEQLSSEYYLPWYNNATTLLDEQLRFGNVDSTVTTVQVSVGSTILGTYELAPGQSLRQSYIVDNGPVRIRSLDGKKVIAAMRAVWKLNGQNSSYSELMGLPAGQLSTEYYFPWYNFAVPNLLDEQLRFGVP